MTYTIEQARIYQWGKEVTPGTAVPATSQITVESMDFIPTDTVNRPKIAKGVLSRNPGDELVTSRGTQFRVPETIASFRQMQHWLGMAVAAVPVATGAGPYVWTFVRSLVAPPAPTTRTIERRLTDGTDNIDNEWAYCFLSKLSFSWQMNEPLKFSAEGFARAQQASTLTAGQVQPTIDTTAAQLGKVYIDPAWASVGSTQIVAQVLSMDFSYSTGLMPKPMMDGRADLDFTSVIFNPAEAGFDVTIRILIKANSGQFATEKTAAKAQSLRAVRFDIADAANEGLTLDFLCKHESGDLASFAVEDGQDVAELKLVDSTDGTNSLEAVVTNGISTDS